MLHRPYIRKGVRQEVENRAQKNSKGQFLDSNTHKPIDGKYDLGHKPGHEFWREAEKAEKEGLTQEQFNNRMNNPDLYHIESPHENRSHFHEMPKTQTNNNKQTHNDVDKGGKTEMGKNEFLDSIKVDKATQQRLDAVTKQHSQNNRNSSSKTKSDNGGRERGDSMYGRESGLKHGGEEGGKASSSASSHNSTSAPSHTNGGQASSSGHGSAGSSSGSGHSSGSSGTGGHGSGGQGSGGGHGSSGGHGGH